VESTREGKPMSAISARATMSPAAALARHDHRYWHRLYDEHINGAGCPVCSTGGLCDEGRRLCAEADDAGKRWECAKGVEHNVCAICHAPATGFVNVRASAASSVPSAFEARCDAHNPYRLHLTAIPTPTRSQMPISESDGDSAGATTRGGQR
jgi:hypothetical protein